MASAENAHPRIADACWSSPTPRRCAATASARTVASSRATCPTLEKFFHYRNLDVSTLKELARRWAPGLIPGFSKRGEHKALADIQESIRELAYYREHFLAPEYQKL